MRLFLIFKKFKIEDSIIICGEPRSGTTWLLDLLAKIPHTFTNFEPLHQSYGVVPKKWNWGDRVFIPKEDATIEYYGLIKNILILKSYSKETLRYWMQSISLLLNSKYVITKFVRINLLLPYIVTHFKLKNRPILILRHPIDTCLSQMKAFRHYTIFPRKIPNSLNNERYLREVDYLQNLTSVLEYNIAIWCINNCPLLEDKETLKKLTLVFYSDLVLNPEKETYKIFSELTCVKTSDIDKIISSINFQQASNTDFKKDYIPNPNKQLQKNIDKLTEEEKGRIQKVFDHFNLKLYDAYSVFPKKEMLSVK